MSKEGALKALALADMESVAAELAMAKKQDVRRSAVRAAMEAGCTAQEVGEVLQVSPQRVYQIRDASLRQTE